MADWSGMKFPKGGKASMTGAEWLAQSKSKRNKFGAVSTNGFPSKLEAAVYAIHEMRVLAGEIRDLKRYPSVALTKRIRWKVDMSYTICATGEPGFTEAKGAWTADANLKLNLWREQGPGKLEIWQGDHRSPRLTEVVTPESCLSIAIGPPLNERPPEQGSGQPDGQNE